MDTYNKCINADLRFHYIVGEREKMIFFQILRLTPVSGILQAWSEVIDLRYIQVIPKFRTTEQ